MIKEFIDAINQHEGLHCYGEKDHAIVKEVTHGSQRIAEISTNPSGFANAEKLGDGTIWVVANRPSFSSRIYVQQGHTSVQDAVNDVIAVQIQYLAQVWGDNPYTTDGHLLAEEESGDVIGPSCQVGYRSAPYITPEPSANEIAALTCIECASGARHANRAIGNQRTFRLLDKRWKELLAAR